MSVGPTRSDGRNSGRRNGSNEDKAKALLEEVARIRAQVAELEGKTVDEVNQEAQAKKDMIKEGTSGPAVDVSDASDASEQQPTDRRQNGYAVVQVPYTPDEMVEQAAQAVHRAWRDGVLRQTVRLALMKEGTNIQELEQWPGGAQQMAREAGKPLSTDLLRETMRVREVFRPELTMEDIWDFDGSAIVGARPKQKSEDTDQSVEDTKQEAQDSNSKDENDIKAILFANTDSKYLTDIQNMDKKMKSGLFLLVNPFWRDIDSWGINILAPGAKTKAQAVIFDRNYEETYCLLRLSVRGEFCVAVKAYPYQWQFYAFLEDDFGFERPVRLGASDEPPNNDLITELLNARPEFRMSKTMRQMKK